jgi:hypothetical protein
MSDKPVFLVPAPRGYANWVGELKSRIHNAQQWVAHALRDKTQPLGVAEYQLVEFLPEQLQTNLTRIERIELELGGEHE